EAKVAERPERTRPQRVIADRAGDLERQTSMQLGGGDPLDATDLEAQPLVNRRLQRKIGARLVKGLSTERDRMLGSSDLLDVAEENESLCSSATPRRPRQELVCVRAGSAAVTGEQLHPRSRDRAAVSALFLLRPCQAKRMLGKLSRREACPATSRDRCCLVECRSDDGVGLERRERQVSRPRERIVDQACEKPVRAPAVLDGQLLIERGSQQRMRKADVIIPALDHARSDGRGERV